jgi:hypothetical protein
VFVSGGRYAFVADSSIYRAEATSAEDLSFDVPIPFGSYLVGLDTETVYGHNSVAVPNGAPPFKFNPGDSADPTAVLTIDPMQIASVTYSDALGEQIATAMYDPTPTVPSSVPAFDMLIDQSVEAQRYLQLRGAGGLTLNESTKLLPAAPTRTAVMEELIHAQQFANGASFGSSGALEMEAEAAETLINNRIAYQLPNDEVRQVVNNLRNIRTALGQ